MKSLLKTKNASATVIVSIIATCIITGGIIAGAYFAKNRTTYITYQEAIDIATAIPEVASFIENNDITSISAERVDAIWTVEFYADQLNYSIDYTEWLNYAIVEINAVTGEVLYYQVYEANNPHYTKEEIIEIANNIPEISEWLSDQSSVYIDAWFDGYDNYWYVEYFSNGSLSQAMAVISDITGEVIEYEIYDPYANATKTKEEIILIAESVPEVQDWLLDNPDYVRYVDYFDFPFNNSSSTGGYWSVNYLSGYRIESSWIYIYIDDLSGEVLDIYQALEPQLAEEEVLTIATSIPEVYDFLQTLTSYRTDVWFDKYNAIWSVFYENSYNIYEYARINIDDITGDVLAYQINDLEDPNLTGEEALAIALATPEVQSWLEDVDEYDSYISFADGYWNVDFYLANTTLGNLTTPPEGLIIGLSVVIDDSTGLVVEVLTIVMSKID